MRRERTAGRGKAWQQLLLACALLWSAFLGRPAWAEPLDGPLEVRSAYVTLDNGVYQLTARVAYPFNDETRRALLDGVTLNFSIEAQVQKRRRLWMDATIVAFTHRRELSWHAVTQHYVVRDVEHGEQNSYATLDQALSAIGAIDNWAVLLESQLEPDATYEIGVRAIVRRGNLSGALRALMWWSDSWQRSSDWYTWALPR